MKYITKRTSNTGKKLSAVLEKMKFCLDAQKELSKKYGFIAWRKDYLIVAGGFSSVMFPKTTEVDKTLWKNVNNSNNEWMPKLNTKAGKAIGKEFTSLPCVKPFELNECVGYNTNAWESIGCDWSNEEYFGFDISEKWNYSPPADCKEVTTTRYKQLFGSNELAEAQ